jgi:hypothetical protein
MIITILAYKSDSEDTCRGCVTARYGSEFEFKSTMDRHEAAKFLSDFLFKDMHRGHGESSYDITFLFNGETGADSDWDTDVVQNEIQAGAKSMADAKEVEYQRQETEKKLQNETKRLAEVQKREKEQLKNLQAKYPNAEISQ